MGGASVIVHGLTQQYDVIFRDDSKCHEVT